MNKKLLAPERLRQLPSQFSWIDQQLVRGGHLRDCDHSAWALYLFLATVADSQGLSYYSEATLSRLLQVEPLQLAQARQQLIAGDLLAYQKPLYQVLALPRTFAPASPLRAGQTMSVRDLLRRVVEGGAA